MLNTLKKFCHEKHAWILLCMIYFLIYPTLSYSDIYKWVDEHGKVHFSDKANESNQNEKVTLKVQKSQWKKYDIRIKDVNNILNEKERNRVKRDVNAVYQFFDNKLYFDFYKTVPVSIRLFENISDYHSYLVSKGIGNRQNTRGIYLPKDNEIVVPLNQKQRWRTFWTIKHETSHAIIDSATPFVPGWFNEGLAENMESLGIKNGKLILFPHTENWQLVNRAKKAGKKLEVKSFLSTSTMNFYQNLQKGHFQNQQFAGELVRMLLATRAGRGALRGMIHDYKQGSRTYSSHILEKRYVGGLSTLQLNWNKWIARESSEQIDF